MKTLARRSLWWTPDVGGLVSRLRFRGLRCDFSAVLSLPPALDKQRGAAAGAQARSVPLGGHGTRL